MNKPNNSKCDTCFVIDNVIRCWVCKYRTKEWEHKNMMPIIIQGEQDLYKYKAESEE